LLVGGTLFARHRARFLLIVSSLIAMPALVWYLGAASGYFAWPSGTGPWGFWFGVIAFLIVLFEMALWFRKKLRGRRLGATRGWMFWHVWLGLIAVPLALIHSGFSLGGSLSAWVLILFLIVCASGIWGLLMQQIIPRRLLDDIPAESIVTEMDALMKEYIAEANGLLVSYRTTLGQADGGEHAAESGGVETVVRAPAGYRTAQLPRFFKDQIAPYLSQGWRSGSPLRSRGKATQLFDELRQGPKGEIGKFVKVIDRLEEICECRRQFDAQARLYFWLHNWLCVHAPLSWALTILLVAHAVIALKVW
jgi:hypothetical protein